MPNRYHAPLDPECPDVVRFNESFWPDPMTETCGCADEICETWEDKHRKGCKRCQQYGTHMNSIAARLPDPDKTIRVEYTSRGKRVSRVFDDAYAARQFYVAKDKAGASPKVLKANMEIEP